MCWQIIINYECACDKGAGSERCVIAQQRDIEQCENIIEQRTEGVGLCYECDQKAVAQQEEEQFRQVLEQSVAEETQRRQHQGAPANAADEESMLSQALHQSMAGITLEDRWEIDEAQMEQLRLASRREWYESQPHKEHMVSYDDYVAQSQAQWTQREIKHDFPKGKPSHHGDRPLRKYPFAPRENSDLPNWGEDNDAFAPTEESHLPIGDQIRRKYEGKGKGRVDQPDTGSSTSKQDGAVGRYGAVMFDSESPTRDVVLAGNEESHTRDSGSGVEASPRSHFRETGYGDEEAKPDELGPAELRARRLAALEGRQSQ